MYAGLHCFHLQSFYCVKSLAVHVCTFLFLIYVNAVVNKGYQCTVLLKQQVAMTRVRQSQVCSRAVGLHSFISFWRSSCSYNMESHSDGPTENYLVNFFRLRTECILEAVLCIGLAFVNNNSFSSVHCAGQN